MSTPNFLQVHIYRAKNGVFPNGLYDRINDIIDFEFDETRSRLDCGYYYANMKGISEKDTQNIREYYPDLPKQFNVIITASYYSVNPILSLKFENKQNTNEELYVNY
jgi:hypothetical protein